MRIFVYEYTCAALSWRSLPASLRAEGRAMLGAVLDDFGSIAGIETCTLLAPDFPGDMAHQCRRHEAEEKPIFCELAAKADYSLVIAPEFDDLLTTRCRWIDEAGGRSLNCSLQATALTADKLALAKHFQQNGIPAPATSLLAATEQPPSFPVVCKPRRGTGSQSTFLVHCEKDWPDFLHTIEKENPAQEMILQPFIPGMSVSVAFFIGPQQCLPLVPARQLLSDDGRFQYLGGEFPLPEPLAGRAVSLARRAVDSVPGLRGYAGVDLVLGNADDGSGDVIIEINPRLTTSYIGLRQLCQNNLAGALLQIVNGEKIELGWTNGFIHFRSDGCFAVSKIMHR